MARVRLDLPQSFSFHATIPVRITDLNYGGHVGNDTILGLIHEARMLFLKNLGYTELRLEGVGLIMSDAAIEYRSELFYGDLLHAEVTAADLGRSSFDLYYRLTSGNTGKVIAVAKTGMVCYDYEKKKVTALPSAAAEKLAG